MEPASPASYALTGDFLLLKPAGNCQNKFETIHLRAYETRTWREAVGAEKAGKDVINKVRQEFTCLDK